jgi:uncharacterized membrane protein YbhN (UPF0104 family)
LLGSIQNRDHGVNEAIGIQPLDLHVQGLFIEEVWDAIKGARPGWFLWCILPESLAVY